MNPVTAGADQRTVPAVSDDPARTVTCVLPEMLPIVAANVTWPAATLVNVPEPSVAREAMVVSLTDQVASGRRVPVWSMAVKS
jgi:hypothetical protein